MQQTEPKEGLQWCCPGFTEPNTLLPEAEGQMELHKDGLEGSDSRGRKNEMGKGASGGGMETGKLKTTTETNKPSES